MLHFLRRRGDDVASGPVDEVPAPETDQPMIGVALGGGAARGLAHIGVVRALIAKGLRPQIIAGTSIGAVVGACHAAGRLDSFEDWARRLTRSRVISYLDLSFGGSGLIGGGRLASRLDRELGDLTIDDLSARFAAIATEIGTGHEIWLTRGRLVEALRASYALPGIFAPVRIGGRWLMDGALVNPVPVSAARALGARLVIAVNLNADLFGRGTTIHDHGSDEDDDAFIEEVRRRRGLARMFGPERHARRRGGKDANPPGITAVMVDAFNVTQDRITRSRLAGDPPDVLITPRLGNIGLFDFHRAEEAIALGAEAAEKAIEPVMDAIEALR